MSPLEMNICREFAKLILALNDEYGKDVLNEACDGIVVAFNSYVLEENGKPDFLYFFLHHLNREVL